MPPSVQALAADELLYRRIPNNPQFYDPVAMAVLEQAFAPVQNDVDGLSLSRECVGPVGAAATGRAGRTFYVATLRSSDLVSALSLNVVADRDDHAVITNLTYPLRRSKDPAVRDRLAKIYGQLVRAIIAVDGPFPGQQAPEE